MTEFSIPLSWALVLTQGSVSLEELVMVAKPCSHPQPVLEYMALKVSLHEGKKWMNFSLVSKQRGSVGFASF